MFSRLTVAPIVGVLFALLAFFKLGLPASFTEPAVVAAVLLVSAAVTAVARFGHGDALEDAKEWYLSKIIWTQIVAAGFAILALLGVVPSLDQPGVVEAVLGAVGVVSWLIGAKTTKPIA